MTEGFFKQNQHERVDTVNLILLPHFPLTCLRNITRKQSFGKLETVAVMITVVLYDVSGSASILCLENTSHLNKIYCQMYILACVTSVLIIDLQTIFVYREGTSVLLSGHLLEYL